MRGWRVFHCDVAKKFYVEACRDYDTLSHSKCPMNPDCNLRGGHTPHASLPDPKIPGDGYGNLQDDILLTPKV